VSWPMTVSRAGPNPNVRVGVILAPGTFELYARYAENGDLAKVGCRAAELRGKLRLGRCPQRRGTICLRA